MQIATQRVRYLSKKLICFVLIRALPCSSCRVEEVEPAGEHEHAADASPDEHRPGVFAPLEIVLHSLDRGPGCGDHRAVSESEGREEPGGIDGRGRTRLEGHGEHRRHVGEGAGAEGDAVDETDPEAAR